MDRKMTPAMKGRLAQRLERMEEDAISAPVDNIFHRLRFLAMAMGNMQALGVTSLNLPDMQLEMSELQDALPAAIHECDAKRREWMAAKRAAKQAAE